MMEQVFFEYAEQFGQYQKRSMFGGVGLFLDGAMFALITNDVIFIRGGGSLDKRLNDLGCEKYRHVKKQTTATVNYYDITELFESGNQELVEMIHQSIKLSIEHRAKQNAKENRRLRDLPNMQLTLERMVKKSGVEDVNAFLSLGAVDVFKRVRNTYGKEVDIKLLWKFAGAVRGCHWKLIQEHQQQELLKSL
ncbi:TfoX/Sxy family DNA transformation protein [Vibrio sp. SCSIO 43136]|uniref:TfoX/Sxy family DNA transformation protein n=1 Tax=Vibrio sp. SCSIO 43136 TaxID=2819101 RepID=UPI002075CBAE|nr:TfoX/Sxy family DNA transformation protein [Vibrio sp. SCSIO 43136]USD64150.1 TfoX/Sxy family DNA transformation protein [Vibrio sp. SCSIO 43136]